MRKRVVVGAHRDKCKKTEIIKSLYAVDSVGTVETRAESESGFYLRVCYFYIEFERHQV